MIHRFHSDPAHILDEHTTLARRRGEETQELLELLISHTLGRATRQQTSRWAVLHPGFSRVSGETEDTAGCTERCLGAARG